MTRFPGGLGSSPLRLLEREGSLRHLEELLDAATRGTGSLALVSGEAGAGKTSLVGAFVARAAGRALVLSGGCDPMTSPRPLGPLLDIAAEPDSGVRIDDLDHPRELFAAFLDRMRATIRPILLVIEDLHWADGGTLDFLRFVGRRVDRTKALVVGTLRDDETVTDHPLRVLLGDLTTRTTIHRIRLQPLSLDAVRLLAAGRVRDPERLHRVTGGNPFFVTEIIEAGSELPETVQDAVLARLARLDQAARSVVEVAAIAPRSMEVDYALRLSGATTGAVDRATRSGMLVFEMGRLRFRHELARAAVEASMPSGRRIQMHREMISLLVEGGRQDLARLAHHAVRAEDGPLVLAFAPEAARIASNRGAHREAVRLYESVLAFSELLDPDRQAETRLALGSELALLDRHGLALALTEQAVAHYRGKGDRLALARALRPASGRYWADRRLTQARAAIDEALSLLEPDGSPSDLAAAHYQSGYLWMLHRRHEQAARHIGMAIALAEQCGDGSIARKAMLILGTIELVTGDARRGVAILERVQADASERGDSRETILALGMLGSGGGEARLYPIAIDALERSVELGLRHDEDYAVAYSRAWLARIAFEQGRWDEVAGLASMVGEESEGRGAISPVTAFGALGRTQVRRGEAGAEDTLRRVLSAGEGCEMQHLFSPMCGLAEMAWLEGRPEDVPAVLGSVYEEALVSDSRWARGEVGFWMWRAGAIEGPPDRVAEPFALHMEGRWSEAAEAWAALGCPYEEAMALAEGDPEAAMRALEIFDRLGAGPAASRVRARLRAQGLTRIPRGPRPATRASPYGLTPRQTEVLSLMGEGLSNREIAERLFISPKTAEHHVAAILSRFGVASRAAALRLAALGLPQDGGGSSSR